MLPERLISHPLIMEDTSVSSARVFFSGSKNSNRPGIDPQRVLTVAFFTTVACAGCDSCRATGGYCFPSTASCAWLPSASLCPWPSACSPRCLRYLQPLPLLTRGQMAAKEGAAGEKFKLHIHHLTCTAPTRELVFCSYSRCLFPSVVKSQDDFQSSTLERRGATILIFQSLCLLLLLLQIEVSCLEPEIAMATDCKVLTYNKGL